MNSVDRVKQICKERKIPLSKLEKDLGFANGYISQLRKGTFPADRLAKIAKYLGVSENYLLYGEESEPETGYYLSVETARMAQEIFENKELRILFDAARTATPEDLQLVTSMVLALKKKEGGADDTGC